MRFTRSILLRAMNGIIATVIILLTAIFGVMLVIYDFDIFWALGGMFTTALVGALLVACYPALRRFWLFSWAGDSDADLNPDLD